MRRWAPEASLATGDAGGRDRKVPPASLSRRGPGGGPDRLPRRGGGCFGWAIGSALLIFASSLPPAASFPADRDPAPSMRDTLITTAIVVRHAERNTDWQGADPPLSPAGRERAEALAQALRDAHVDRIYVTHFLRNRATAEPLAR